MNLFALLEMSRPGNAIIALVTLGAGYFLSAGQTQTDSSFTSFQLLADSVAFMLAIAFANIHNDILDIESDKVNQPNRPLPAGLISVKAATIGAIATIAIALVMAVLPTVEAITHITFYVLLFAGLFLYNRYLKHIPLVKNMTVAFMCTTPLLRMFFHNGFSWEPLYPAIGFAFLYTLAREIVKDLEDVAGDIQAGICTFPIAAGEKKAANFACFIVIATWLLLPSPSLLNWYPATFLLALLPLTPLSTIILVSIKKKSFRKAQKLIKIAMICGLVSLLVAKALA